MRLRIEARRAQVILDWVDILLLLLLVIGFQDRKPWSNKLKLG